MTEHLSADELLAGASTTHRVVVPREILAPCVETDGVETEDGGAESAVNRRVELRPLTIRDIQRIHRAARDEGALTSVLMVQQGLVAPSLSVEQVANLSAGMVQFLLRKVNEISGLELDEDELERAVRAPLARACFILSREFGWKPEECSELTLAQVLLYLEMVARGESTDGNGGRHGSSD